MVGLDLLIWIGTFLAGTCLVYGVMHYVGSRRLLKNRFRRATEKAMPLYQGGGNDTPMKRFLEWVSSFGKFGMKDKEGATKLRFALLQAGFRHPQSTAIFYGLQALTGFFLPLPYLLLNLMNGTMAAGSLAITFLLAGGGFYLPQYILKFMTSRRQDRIDKALPDVLDLLIVLLEAGLSLQSTLNRVSDEVRPISMELYHELHLTNAELRTGITRETALKNMGERTGVQSVKSLVGMMIQSEKMGTSMSQALRIHSNFLRVQRAQKAEAIAAKLPVKIMFPMMAFIFPAIFIVVLGPAAINLLRSSFFAVAGGH
ncbi:MAG: type II secretion system F family protein [Deltaproteobacteria bacterium]|nr:type II secretion system F family protein [Deltaproteobacteria bacterium]